jgi:hypothetical protein
VYDNSLVTRITATFFVSLDVPFLVREPRSEIGRTSANLPAMFKTAFGRFETEVGISGFGAQDYDRRDGTAIREAGTITLLITGDESPPPPAGANEGDRRGYVAGREREYREAACAVFARFVRYLRFKLGTPLIQAESHWLQKGMLNPKWTEDHGRVIWDRPMVSAAMLGPTLPLYPRCGVSAYEASDHLEVVAALAADIEVPFRMELLAEARDAIATGHLRRAILEIAIACEVGVKHFYFQPDTHAETAYSYLEDKGRVNTRVLEFLDGIAVRTFGRSLREDQPETYRNIDWLFRCRNKVAHRGIARFRDDAGTEINADRQKVCEWWLAVDTAFRWLDAVVTEHLEFSSA